MASAALILVFVLHHPAESVFSGRAVDRTDGVLAEPEGLSQVQSVVIA
jgi:hypothetical protein